MVPRDATRFLQDRQGAVKALSGRFLVWGFAALICPRSCVKRRRPGSDGHRLAAAARAGIVAMVKVAIPGARFKSATANH
jgi:hypothetical protein